MTASPALLGPLGPVAPPEPVVAGLAADRLAGLATPAGALGRLGDLAVWASAALGSVPPPLLDGPGEVRLVVLAGDHGVSAHGVSAYPAAITPAMVHLVVAGRSGVSTLAAAHGVSVRVLDVGVDDDLDGAPAAVRDHKVTRGSGAIHLVDALSHDDATAAFEAGRVVAREEVAAGGRLLMTGDLGIGNTTPAAALVAARLGLPADQVVGRGTGVDDEGLARKTAVVQAALDRTLDVHDDPFATLAALGSADLAAAVGFLVEAAGLGVPVLLDGLMSVACALTADALAPGAAAWFAAGHRSTEPAQSMALEKLGLEPLLDLGLRLGEGSGAVAAVPVVRSAVALLAGTALLGDVLP
ncbi:nicotinate-nucleotide--dimethylbenzimidazole phosphoribosyltransferase [Nocardioides bruguierae]|uniref:nicotinate-nucleotide--dimethylbenzimidazole phosphoribosyltransferase n=1 Tax=Nocardioides bruguierae TaxID=2945102 RepID=UPI0020203751|nr:nicotinate-nucleotide--dimethylbenzimidazole phosphoribosyltransferase [Nocardioides bruguierae]MCL8026949.1 nicotinate-nucleotide--dimethylbenzimidazole phosphoribosyltransferase [Nocardioides bruguierae]